MRVAVKWRAMETDAERRRRLDYQHAWYASDSRYRRSQRQRPALRLVVFALALVTLVW